MALVRRLYTWAELNESAAAMALIDRLEVVTRRELERYADLSEDELAIMLATMNRNGSDFGHRFCYDEYLGGLAHVQWSYVSDEDFFSVLPADPCFPAPRPIDRVALRANGIVCTLAPAHVSSMYRVTMENCAIVMTYRNPPLIPTGEPPRLCAYCLTRAATLLDCDCGVVHYCDERCQQAHRREGHWLLCNWCISCMDSFGTIRGGE